MELSHVQNTCELSYKTMIDIKLNIIARNLIWESLKKMKKRKKVKKN